MSEAIQVAVFVVVLAALLFLFIRKGKQINRGQ
jgi:hypothetical protein